MSDDSSNRDTNPFLNFYSGLALYGRLMESSCKLSLNMVEAMDRAGRDAAEWINTEKMEATMEQMTALAARLSPVTDSDTGPSSPSRPEAPAQRAPSQPEKVAASPKNEEPRKEPPKKTAPSAFPGIPSTNDVELSTQAVTMAMNEAARRKLSEMEDLAEAERETAKTVENAKATLAEARASISAAKTRKIN